MLSKLIIDDSSSLSLCSSNIKNYMINNEFYKGLIIEDCFNKIHTNLKSSKRIFQLFNKKIVAISSNSFQQTNIILAKEIRQYVTNIIENTITNDNLLCIGGESYLYGLTTNNKVIHITNNENIKNDCDYNFQILFNNKNLIFNNKINYSFLNESFDYKIKDIVDSETKVAIINLSKLLVSVANFINNSNINKLIIINCHHDDFWKKIKYLTNYKLLERKKFVCDKLNYFITVNVFIRQNNIISFGNNCSIAYQLNKLNVRNSAYPFDWCSSTLQKLINVLQNSFIDYSSSLKFKKKSDNHLPVSQLNDKTKLLNTINDDDLDYSYILQNKYNIDFAHEVLTENTIENFKKSLDRRIERFKCSINPLFIRLENKKVNITNYELLLSILDKYFQQNYKIIVISTFKCPRIINNKIKFIYTSNPFINWQYDNINWKEILINN